MTIIPESYIEPTNSIYSLINLFIICCRRADLLAGWPAENITLLTNNDRTKIVTYVLLLQSHLQYRASEAHWPEFCDISTLPARRLGTR